jgi:hypothetical protein
MPAAIKQLDAPEANPISTATIGLQVAAMELMSSDFIEAS